VGVGEVGEGAEITECTVDIIETGAVQFGGHVPRWLQRWNAAVEKLSNANDKVQNLKPGRDCQGDLTQILAATGIGLFGIQLQANTSEWGNGMRSTELQRDLFPAGSDSYSRSGTGTISAVFRNSMSGTVAESGLPGSALAGMIFFNPGYVNQHTTSFDAALLMHEVIHNLGAIDSSLMGALGFDPADPITDKATKKLAKDCFGVTGREVQY
jgi:hypothetical protein